MDERDEQRVLSPDAYSGIRSLLHEVSGIELGTKRQELVKARVAKRLRALGLASFDEYVARLASDPSEVPQMVDVLTTNKTSFFREPAHFTFVVEHGIPRWRSAGRRLRLWSAGCSSGEEPYSLAMTLLEHLGGSPAWDARILATDISPRVLDHARAGRYGSGALWGLPAAMKKHFEVCGGEVRLRERVRELVQFAGLNLLGEWPMRGPFDAIFCRNVMIYFDAPTRNELVQRFRTHLAPEGWLFVGHCESLGPAPAGLRAVAPATYARCE